MTKWKRPNNIRDFENICAIIHDTEVPRFNNCPEGADNSQNPRMTNPLRYRFAPSETSDESELRAGWAVRSLPGHGDVVIAHEDTLTLEELDEPTNGHELQFLID